MLIVAQSLLGRALAQRRRPAHRPGGPATATGVFLSGAYGGYFGAAQGILLLAILGLALDDELQRINALKVVLAGLVNLIADELHTTQPVNTGSTRRALIALILCAATLAGCATAGRGPVRLTAAGSVTAVSLSQCMRAYGVANFPEPTDGPGGAALTVNRPTDGSAVTINGIPFSGPAFDSAVQACWLFAGKT